MSDLAKRRERYRINRAGNLERERERGRKKAMLHRARHPEKVLAEKRTYYVLNADRCREAAREYSAENPQKIACKAMRRNAAKRQAIPSWARNEFEELAIAEIYDLAALRSKYTGIRWNVDHVVPLISTRVCGLHCSANLQVIPARANFSKGNRFWPEM